MKGATPGGRASTMDMGSSHRLLGQQSSHNVLDKRILKGGQQTVLSKHGAGSSFKGGCKLIIL